MPVFTLEAQEGRLFSPLAFTKTYAMAAAAGAVGHAGAGADGLPDPRAHPARNANPHQPFLIAVYRPLLDAVLRRRSDAGLAALLLAVTSLSASRISAASSCRRWTRATCCTCRPRCPACPRQGRRVAAADRPPHQDRAGGGERVRQGRPRRDRHRPGAAGDVRDHHPVQAARRSGGRA